MIYTLAFKKSGFAGSGSTCGGQGWAWSAQPAIVRLAAGAEQELDGRVRYIVHGGSSWVCDTIYAVTHP
jgi:hypothetical protein